LLLRGEVQVYFFCTFLFPYFGGKEKEKIPKEKGNTEQFLMPYGHNLFYLSPQGR